MIDQELKELAAKSDALQKELTSWREKAAIAQAEETRIRKELAEALEQLKVEHGCETYDDAVSKLNEMKSKATVILNTLEENLDALRGR